MNCGLKIIKTTIKMRKGQKHTDEWKQKVKELYKLRANSTEEKERRHKISITGKGRKSAKPMLGRKHSEESKEKMSKRLVGKKRTTEQRKRISDAHIGQKPWNKGVPSKYRGEKNPNWKGGITSVANQIRHCFEYRQWLSDCMSRVEMIGHVNCALFVEGNLK